MTNRIDKPFSIVDKMHGLTATSVALSRAGTRMKTISAIFAAAALCAIPQVSAAEDAEVPGYDMAAKCAATDTVLAVLFEAGTPSESDKASAAEMTENAKKWTIIALAQSSGDADAVQEDITNRGTSLLTKISDAGSEDDVITAIGDDMIDCLVYEATVFDAAKS